MGYVHTAVTVYENEGVAQLTVGISMPPRAVPIETSFSLLVNTVNGAATGLPWRSRLEFNLCVHTLNDSQTIILYLSLFVAHERVHAHTHTHTHTCMHICSIRTHFCTQNIQTQMHTHTQTHYLHYIITHTIRYISSGTTT